MPLTDTAIRNAKPGEKPAKIFDERGLFLLVTPTGGKWWRLRYKFDGKDAQGRQLLSVEMTMTDPKFYTKPVVIQKRWAKVPNGRVLPYECPEERWLDRIEEMAKKAGVPVP